MIDAALSFIDPTDRDTWVKMAFAVKSELGESGFDIWNVWSQQADSYKEHDAKSVWRSAKEGGGITVGTLYAEARRAGYQGDEVKSTAKRDFAKEREQKQHEARRRQQAAAKASRMLRDAELLGHPYLASKGHPKELGFVLDGFLLVPMRDWKTGEVNSLQTIDGCGNKKFLAGGRARGSVFVIGSGIETYLCEGYATALSVKAALVRLYRKARVVVCFSASNMAHVAQFMGQFVVADHDQSGTGEKYAKQTGLPWWMPPDLGDANDFHQTSGIDALANAVNELRRFGVGLGSGSGVKSAATGERNSRMVRSRA